jgi:SSS family solute:Na+ symporter
LLLQHCFNFSTNQFLVQRALSASSDEDARKGIIVSGMLKLLIPFFSIATGIAAFYLFRARFGVVDFNSDNTFLKLVETVIPSGTGLTGMILAGLTAATFSSVDSMMNAATTLLTIDVYQKYIHKDANDRAILRFGRWTIVVMVFVAIGIALLTYTPDRSNNFILRISAQLSYFTPGIMAAFFFGVLWPGATARGAVAAMLLGPVFGLALEWGYPYSLGRIPAIASLFGGQLNFLHRIFLSFLLSSITILVWKDQAGKERREAGYNALKINVSGKKVARLVGIFLGIQLVVIGFGYGFQCPARVLAPVGAVGAWGVFFPYLWRSKRRFWESDVFYAALLSSASIWVYYYFA